jgi:hypothetical protein
MSELTELALRKLLSNVGYADKKQTIIRSGQPKSLLKLKTFYKLFPFKTVINLAWSPGTDDDDRDEYRFCLDNNIVYHKFTWGASVPHTAKYEKFWLEEFPLTVKLIDTVKKPLWIHCEGGRDRTGGLVAAWKLVHNYKLMEVFDDFHKYGMPDEQWLYELFYGVGLDIK